MPSGRWLQPYKVLSYDRPEDPAGSATAEGQEPVAGAAGVPSGVPSANASRRDANLDTASPLAAGFGRCFNPVPEGLVRGNGKVSCPQNQ